MALRGEVVRLTPAPPGSFILPAVPPAALLPLIICPVFFSYPRHAAELVDHTHARTSIPPPISPPTIVPQSHGGSQDGTQIAPLDVMTGHGHGSSIVCASLSAACRWLSASKVCCWWCRMTTPTTAKMSLPMRTTTSEVAASVARASDVPPLPPPPLSAWFDQQGNPIRREGDDDDWRRFWSSKPRVDPDGNMEGFWSPPARTDETSPMSCPECNEPVGARFIPQDRCSTCGCWYLPTGHPRRHGDEGDGRFPKHCDGGGC